LPAINRHIHLLMALRHLNSAHRQRYAPTPAWCRSRPGTQAFSTMASASN